MFPLFRHLKITQQSNHSALTVCNMMRTGLVRPAAVYQCSVNQPRLRLSFLHTRALDLVSSKKVEFVFVDSIELTFCIITIILYDQVRSKKM